MRIKYVDKNGSLKTEHFDDDADFSVLGESDGTIKIEAYKSAHTNKSGMLYRKILTLASGKTTANKCIDRIHDQLIAKKDFCDLAEIQLGNSVDDTLTDENE